jgi:hypothetical protein
MPPGGQAFGDNRLDDKYDADKNAYIYRVIDKPCKKN